MHQVRTALKVLDSLSGQQEELCLRQQHTAHETRLFNCHSSISEQCHVTRHKSANTE